MTVKEIAPQEVQGLTAEGWAFIDVRSPAEWSAVHAIGTLNLPLDQMDEKSLSRICGDKVRAVFICQGGGRSRKACEAIAAMNGARAVSVAGGTTAWEAQGLSVERGKGIISIERQVRIAAGSLVLSGALLALCLNPWFLVLPLFVGSGLIFSGITDFCGMALILAKMPWNQKS